MGYRFVGWSVSLRHQTDGTPEAIYHGRILRWGLSSLTDAVRFTEAINRGDLDHLFERIAAGHTIEWDGSNHIGHMTEDAATAFYAVDDAVTDWLFFQCELTGKNAGLWDAGDWLSEYGYEAIAEDHNLLIPVSDEELATVADALDAEARREQIVLCGTYEWLKKEAQ
jgi:hypothetical protein